MFKQALRSYFSSLHPRNFRKIKELSGVVLWIYWFVVNPIMTDVEGTGTWKFQIFFWFTTLTPFFMMWWSNLGHKLSMSKLMYLLPLHVEERKKYIDLLLVIKIGVPVLVGMGLDILFAVVYGRDWWVIILCAVCTGSFGIGMYICTEGKTGYNRYIRYAVRENDGARKDAWLNWVCMVYSVIVVLFFSMGEVETERENFIGWLVFFCIISISVIMDIVIIKTRYKDAVGDVCDYEIVYDTAGKGKGVPLGQMLKL